MINLNSGQVVNKFIGHNKQIMSVAISNDMKYVVVGGLDNKATIYETSRHLWAQNGSPSD